MLKIHQIYLNFTIHSLKHFISRSLKLQKFCKRFILLVFIQNMMIYLLVEHVSNTHVKWSQIIVAHRYLKIHLTPS